VTRRATSRGDALLLCAAAIWGGAFVAQRAIAPHVDALALTAIRFLSGALLLLPVIALRRARRRSGARDPAATATALRGGLAAGLVMLVAFVLQQRGIETGSTATAAGFITGLYVLFVPILAAFVGIRTPTPTWAGAGLAAAGLLLLTSPAGLAPSRGDALVLLCAVAWAVHLLVIGRFARRCDPLELATAQFAVTGGAAAALAGTLPRIEALRAGLWPLLYLGPVAVCLAYTMQVFGQRNAPTSHAAVLLASEAVFAGLFGALVGGERLSPGQLAGCALMFTGVVAAELGARQGERSAGPVGGGGAGGMRGGAGGAKEVA